MYTDVHWCTPPRATGQAHRPAPPVTTGKSSSLNKTQASFQDSKTQTHLLIFDFSKIKDFLSRNLNPLQQGDADKARKHGMEEYIAADPITFEHHALFKKLQSLSLDWRLNDPFASLVSSIFKQNFPNILPSLSDSFLNRIDRRFACLKDMSILFQGWFTPGQVFVLDEYCAR